MTVREPPTLAELLRNVVDLEGSDLHLTMGAPPQVRVHGRLRRLEMPPLTSEDTKWLSYSACSDVQRTRFEEMLELDFAFSVPEAGRFRCHMFHQRGAVGATYRRIPECIRTIAELGLPPIVAQLGERPHGLVLVTGPTGSGKSTTVAAMLDKINADRHEHILTIEDPIEYVHDHKSCLVNQREIHRDTHGFGSALRAALREDPDVVFIGEMRDLETIEAALRIAETGHLTLATLHTSSAVQTITRIVDVFPGAQQSQIRTQLSLVLEGVVSQILVPNVTGTRRMAALEILVATPAIRHLIREDKIHQIYSTMQSGQGKLGMQTMNQSLASLYTSGQIPLEEALAASSMKEELQEMITRRVAARGHAAHAQVRK